MEAKIAEILLPAAPVTVAPAVEKAIAALPMDPDALPDKDIQPPTPSAGPEDIHSSSPTAGTEDVPPPVPPAGPDVLLQVSQGCQDMLLPSPSATAVACLGNSAPEAAAALVGLPPPPQPAVTTAANGLLQPHLPLTASELRTQVRRLDVRLDQMQRQCHDLMEAAFYAMKKDTQRLEEENAMLQQKTTYLVWAEGLWIPCRIFCTRLGSCS